MLLIPDYPVYNLLFYLYLKLSFPGPLNANTGTLSLASQSFVADGVLYEVLLEARKFTQTNVNFTRVSTARIQVNIVAGIPPIMEIL